MKNLALHIMDIMQNSVSAGAENVDVTIKEDKNKLSLAIRDDGKGMSAEMLKNVTDPFFTTRTTRKVGLGIPLLKQNAEITGGFLELKSEIGKGTLLSATFNTKSIDMPPMGDIAGTIALTASSWLNVNFKYTHETPKGKYVFDTKEIKKTLGNVPINDPEIIFFLKEMISENINDLEDYK